MMTMLSDEMDYSCRECDDRQVTCNSHVPNVTNVDKIDFIMSNQMLSNQMSITHYETNGSAKDSAKDSERNIREFWQTDCAMEATRVEFWLKNGWSRNMGFVARNMFLDCMKQSEIYTSIPEGDVLVDTPSEQMLISNLVDHISTFMSKYEKGKYVTTFKHEKTKFEKARSRDLTLEILTNDQCMRECTLSVPGFLTQGFIIAHLNKTRFECPECGSVSTIGWISSKNKLSSSFTEGVCMNCRSLNIGTYFKIKTRVDRAMDRYSGLSRVYAGTFTGINSLISAKANVYMIMASRESSGKISIGKIVRASPCDEFTDSLFCYKLYYNDHRVKHLTPSPTSIVMVDFKKYYTPVPHILDIHQIKEKVMMQALEIYNTQMMK
jgi:hypothetical protein